MPNAFVDKFPGGEEKWKKAKKQAEKEGKGDNYAYITGIFKKMVGASVAEQVIARLSDPNLDFETASGKDDYWEWIDKFDKASAQKHIQKLQAKIARIMARAQRSAHRHEDAGPLDIASEKVAPLENMVALLTWFVKNPKKDPPKELLNNFEEHQKNRAERKEYKDERKAKFEKFPSLVGKRIRWKSRGVDEEGIVQKQKMGKWGDEPVYIVTTDRGRWKIPHGLVTKIITPKDHQKILKNMEKEQEKQKEKVGSYKLGQTVKWDSRRQGKVMEGKIVKIGRTRLKVNVDGVVWKVPVALLID